MKTAVITAILATFTLASAANAATDPWVGKWFHHGKNGAPDHTLTVTKIASGYTFVDKTSDSPYLIPVAVVPDGRLHSTKFQGAAVHSTCRHDGARAIACNMDLAGMKSRSRYALSADGRSLSNTETDPMGSAQVSTQSDVNVNSKGAKTKTSMSAPKTTASEYTSTLVYQKQ